MYNGGAFVILFYLYLTAIKLNALVISLESNYKYINFFIIILTVSGV